MVLCKDCPLYVACVLAHAEVFGGVLSDCGVDSFTKCNYYKQCRNSDSPRECIQDILENVNEEEEEVIE